MGASSRAVVLQFLGESGSLKAVLSGIQKDLATTEGAVGALASVGGKLSVLGSALTRYVSLPLALVGAASVKLALTYDSAMNKVAAITTASKADMDLWYTSVLNLAKTVPIGPEVLAQGLYFVASSGFHGAQAMDILTASAKASTAGLGDVGDVAKTLDAVMNAYKGSTLTATQATDYMIAAISQGDMPSQDLANSIGQVLSIAAQAGVPFKDLAAAIAASSKQGINAQKTAQGLRFMLSRFISPTAQATKVLEKYGWTVGSLNNELQNKGLLPTLQDLKDKMGTTDFSKVVGGARGLSVALALVGQNAQQVSDVFKGVDAAPGSLNKAYATAEENPEVKLKTQINALKVAGVQLGNALLPTVIQIANQLAKLGGWFDGLSPHTKKMVADFLAIGVVLGPVLKIFGPFFKLFAGGLKIVLGIPRAIAIVKDFGVTVRVAMMMASDGVKAFFIGMGPIEWIILALTALGVLFYELYQHSQTFRNGVDEVGRALRTVYDVALKPVVDFFMKHWKLALEVALAVLMPFIGMPVLIWQNWSKISGFFVRIWNNIYAAIATSVGAIGSVIATIGNFFVSIWATIGPTVTKIAKIVLEIFLIPVIIAIKLLIVQWNLLYAFLSAVLPPVFRVLKAAWDVLYNALITGVNFLRTVWSATWNAIADVFTAVWNVLYGLVERLINFYIWEFNLLWSIIVPVWNAIWGAITATWNVVSGFLNAAWRAFASVATSVWNSITGVLSSAWNNVFAVLKTVWTNIKNFLSGIWDSYIAPILDTLGKSISKVGSSIWDGLKTGFRDAINAIIGAWDGFVKQLHVPSVHTPFGSFGGWDPAGGLNIQKIGKLANGIITNIPMIAQIGEAGKEAVIPLTRPARAMELADRSGLTGMILSRLGGRQSDKPSVHIENLNVTQQGLSSPDATARAVAWELRRRIA